MTAVIPLVAAQALRGEPAVAGSHASVPPALAPTGYARAATTPFDWGLVARLLAEGVAVERIAATFGRQPREIRRQVKRSARLRRAIAMYRDGDAGDAAARLVALRRPVVERLERLIQADNPRVLLWLADRLRIFDRDAIADLPGMAESEAALSARRRARGRLADDLRAKLEAPTAPTGAV